jgi:hypothetical protein
LFDQTFAEPLNVDPPYAISIGATYLEIGWSIPTLINGVLTGFQLTEAILGIVYSGGLMSYNVSNLTVRRLAELEYSEFFSLQYLSPAPSKFGF